MFSSEARKVFLAWERLRLIYNGLLIPGVCLLAWVESHSLPPFHEAPLTAAPTWREWTMWWVIVAAYGVFSNLCFLLGPAVEVYLGWLGLPTRAVRWFVFTLGTLFTAIAAALFIVFTVPRYPVEPPTPPPAKTAPSPFASTACNAWPLS
ncbi:hypothetical protein MalM25_30160 [Planctomycetes bacterium MalM25]|nr:hypothetical protein MalM25_30160 [Planctomycetes bacterium MalM25]